MPGPAKAIITVNDEAYSTLSRKKQLYVIFVDGCTGAIRDMRQVDSRQGASPR